MDLEDDFGRRERPSTMRMLAHVYRKLAYEKRDLMPAHKAEKAVILSGVPALIDSSVS